MDIEHSKAGEGEKTTPTGLAMEAPSAAEPTVALVSDGSSAC